MRRVALAIFTTIAGLVGLLSFKDHSTSTVAAIPAISTAPTTGSASTSSATPSTSPTSSSSSSSAAKSTKTITGNSVDTRWGPVQVKITVTNGKITSATAVDYPENNGRDQQINAVAIPTLEKESIGKSTANIDMVSGATYTSTGYIQSLQSALDKL